MDKEIEFVKVFIWLICCTVNFRWSENKFWERSSMTIDMKMWKYDCKDTAHDVSGLSFRLVERWQSLNGSFLPWPLWRKVKTH